MTGGKNLSSIDFSSTDETVLRSFSRLVGVGLVIFSLAAYLVPWGIFLWAHEYYPVFAGLGCLMLLWGHLAPRTLGPVYKVWLVIGLTLGFINIRILLFIMYFFVFTPFAFWFRLIGRDRLKMKMKKNAITYWDTYDAHPATLERYRRLF